MNQAIVLTLSALAGALLGGVFFGGLWWTVQRGLTSNGVAAWFLSSLLLRTTIVISGFFFVAHDDYRRVLACLAGFLVARTSVTLLTRRPLRGIS